MEDDGDDNGNAGRIDSEKPRRKSIAVNRPGETFTARDRPFSSASHTSLRAAFEAIRSIPLEPASPTRNRGSRTSLIPSPEQHKKSYIPVRARPGQAETRATTNNGMASQVSGWRSSLARGSQMNRGRRSSSSPPRGLREAYARILDEENLAAEESAVSEMEDEFDDSPVDWSSPHCGDPKKLRDQDQARLECIQNSDSPLLLPRPRPSSPQPGLRSIGKSTGANHHGLDDSTLDSGSASVISGLSSLENGTEDSFARTLARHARDQQRINGAMKTENRVFSRARQPERAGLTSENLRRKDKVDEIMDLEREVAEEAASVTSDLSDIPVRLPKHWGRRGRKRNDWLSKIQEAEDAESRRKNDAPEPDEESSTRRIDSSQPESSSIDWVAAAADVPLPSVEEKPSHEIHVQQTVTPPPSREQTGSIERIEHYPLVSSKPLVGSKNNLLDRIREREIEALKDQAVTTNRLGELKERNSNEQLRSRHISGQIGERAIEDSEVIKAAKRSLGLDAQDSFLNLSQGKEKDDGSDSTRDRSDAQQNMGKLEQKKPDSRDLLLQLARAASSSPSPTIDRDKRNLSEEVNRSEQSQNQSGPASSEDQLTVTSGEPAKKSREAKQAAMEESDTDEDSTPKQGKGPVESQTPALAIGGWVDTPVGHNLKSPSEQDVDKEKSAANLIHDVSSSPLYRRSSGLTGPARKDDQANRITIGLQRTISAPEPNRHPTQGSHRQLEAEIDLTIDSINRLIENNDMDITPLLQNGDAKIRRLGLEDGTDKSLNNAEHRKRSDILAYEQMNKRLQTLRLSMHDAKKDTENVENQVQHTFSTGQPGIWSCSECGHLVVVSSAGEHGHQKRLQLPFALPKTHGWKEGSRRPRLTWLGVFCLILASIYGYFLAERITW